MPDTAAEPTIDTAVASPSVAPSAAVPSPTKVASPGTVVGKQAATASPLTPTPTRQRVSDAIRKAAEAGPTPPGQEGKRTTAADTSEKPSAQASDVPQKGADKPEATQTPPGDQKAATAPSADRGKQSPWKLLDTWKAKVGTLEQQLAEAKKQADPTVVSSLNERVNRAEGRVKELEEEMRYVNYSKTQEYQDQFQRPLEDAWAAAVADMRELQVTGADGSVRTATAQDLLALANMPLGEARKAAEEWFGEAANDVMAHRKTIRELDSKQQQALANARKQGSEREQQRGTVLQQIRTEVKELWEQLKAEHSQKYDFLKPKEDDNDWNARLEKATTFVDKSLADMAKINDPRTTKEERADIVRRHLAVRNRAIGFATRTAENKQLRAQLAELQKQIDEFKAGEPGGGNGRPQGEAVVPSGPLDRMEAAKAKIRALAQ